MKRYNIAHRFVDGLGVDENPEGEWVKWEDHKDGFFRVTEMYEKRIRELKAKIELKGVGSEGGKMKKYYPDYKHFPFEVIMVEDDQGGWVQWEDVNKLIKEATDSAYKAGYFAGQNNKPNPEKMERPHPWPDPPDNIKCNCGEYAFTNDPYTMPVDIWICPAHGYKRR
jgi:hypothetical protein